MGFFDRIKGIFSRERKPLVLPPLGLPEAKRCPKCGSELLIYAGHPYCPAHGIIGLGVIEHHPCPYCHKWFAAGDYDRHIAEEMEKRGLLPKPKPAEVAELPVKGVRVRSVKGMGITPRCWWRCRICGREKIPFDVNYCPDCGYDKTGKYPGRVVRALGKLRRPAKEYKEEFLPFPKPTISFKLAMNATKKTKDQIEEMRKKHPEAVGYADWRLRRAEELKEEHPRRAWGNTLLARGALKYPKIASYVQVSIKPRIIEVALSWIGGIIAVSFGLFWLGVGLFLLGFYITLPSEGEIMSKAWEDAYKRRKEVEKKYEEKKEEEPEKKEEPKEKELPSEEKHAGAVGFHKILGEEEERKK